MISFKSKYIYFIFFILFFTSCTSSMPKEFNQEMKVGKTDKELEKEIELINKLLSLYDTKNYESLVSILTLNKNNTSDYNKKTLFLNEIADIYSYLIMDLEFAIKIDEEIQKNKEKLHSREIENNISYVSNNKFVSSKYYINKYRKISMRELLNLSEKRLLRNKKILDAEEIGYKTKYTQEFISKNIQNINQDITNTVHNKNINRQMISRLLKAEFELYKITNNIRDIKYGYKYFINSNINLDEIAFDEIDFLSLSKYLKLAFEKTKNIDFSVWSLNAIYKPYLNIRNEENRWKYNKLVNKAINSLINTHYEHRSYQEMLYYISLNKSRMILEDRVSSNNILNIQQLKNNLPDKISFISNLKNIKDYLGFYTSGDIITKTITNEKTLQLDDDIFSLSSKRALRVKNNKVKQIEVLEESYLFSYFISNNKIVVKRNKKLNLQKTKKKLEVLYRSLKQDKMKNNRILKESKVLLSKLLPSDIKTTKLTVSVDKWLNKYPLSAILETDVIRTLSLQTYSNKSEYIDESINIVGFFNPTKDLADADIEVDYIKKYFPKLKSYSKEEASLANLQKMNNIDILHLSMHGYNNSYLPKYSKLLFSKSILDSSTDDKNALYAKDMYSYEQLKNNQLIFTAACETGITKRTKDNQSEILGILRPLLINNNKNVILTLWEVNSKSAKDFVVYFYKNLSKTNNIQKAFFMAKSDLKMKYKNPYHWAAYYLHKNF